MPSTHPALASLHVIKKIAADGRGAPSLSTEYGDELVCVRDRIDPTGTKRVTTV